MRVKIIHPLPTASMFCHQRFLFVLITASDSNRMIDLQIDFFSYLTKNIFMINKGDAMQKLKLLILFFAAGSLFAQGTFTRVSQAPVPVEENCGFGNMVSGLDLDGDTKTEIYAVNNMWDQGGAELIPRLYKFEWNGTSWDSVWAAVMTTIPMQNTWPALTVGDLDGDGKKEIIWGPANNMDATNANPARILVFEAPGDGSDNMGVNNFGNFVPNTSWTITNQDNFEVRPFRWVAEDVDSDGKQEIIFADRRANYRFGVVSVSDVPDFGSGSETWTLEASGLGNTTIDGGTIYDLAVVGPNIYLIHDTGVVTPVKYAGGSWTVGAPIADMVPGGSWKSACVADIDGNGSKEIVVAGWSSTSNKIYLLQEDNFAGLTSTVIGDAASLIGATGRMNGGAVGDLDNDGKVDFVFGGRATVPENCVVRLEYNGGDIAQPANYTVSVIDSLYPLASARLDIVNISNVDADADMEVLYTNGITGLMPIVVLDRQSTDIDDENLLNSFVLNQNYPNPFNPSTTISFTLPKEMEVKLTVFNTLGEEVAIPFTGLMSAGVHSLQFHANNLNSGIYFYQLTSGELSQTMKMILTK